jgi:hypothetical protein
MNDQPNAGSLYQPPLENGDHPSPTPYGRQQFPYPPIGYHDP